MYGERDTPGEGTWNGNGNTEDYLEKPTKVPEFIPFRNVLKSY